MKKACAVLFAVSCLLGLTAVAAPAANAIPIHFRGSADLDPPNDEELCIRINVTIRGTTIGTGPEFVCIPLS